MDTSRENKKRIYESLVKCNPKEVTTNGDYDERFIDESAIMNLHKFFRVCVDRNLGLNGWW